MTGKQEGYDPFAYGQVRLGGGRGGTPAGAPEDILFDPSGTDEGPAEEPAFAEQGGGGPQYDNAAVDFGNDILGGSATGGSSLLTKPMPGDADGRQAAEGPGAAFPQARRGESGVRVRETPVPQPRPMVMQRRRGSMASVMWPPAALAIGCSAGAWLWLVQENLVMAGVAAGLGVLAAAFSWIWLRG